jgi:hypothetical protein
VAFGLCLLKAQDEELLSAKGVSFRPQMSANSHLPVALPCTPCIKCPGTTA